MTLKKKLYRCQFYTLRIDYDFWLPVSSRLPLIISQTLTRWRGLYNWVLNRDWIELAIGTPYIAERAFSGYREMMPNLGNRELCRYVSGRYMTIAREEHEAQLAIDNRLRHYSLNSPLLDHLASCRTPRRGLVIAIPHIDNLFLTCAGLANRLGPVHLVTSAVVEDPRIHPSLLRFYRRKYAAYEKMMRGGRFLHTSSYARNFFYDALRRGESVVILTDAPATKEGPGCWVSWFGKSRKVPNGALLMAIETGSEMVGVSSHWSGPNTIDWCMTSILDPGATYSEDVRSPSFSAYQTIFSFMEECIKKKPEGWWAAHLLGDYQTKPPEIEHFQA